MLEGYARLALALQALRLPAIALIFVSLGALLLGIFALPGEDGQRLSMLALGAALCSGLLVAFLLAFRAPLPVADPAAGWLHRVTKRLQRLYLWLLALSLSVLLPIVLWFAGRAILMDWRS